MSLAPFTERRLRRAHGPAGRYSDGELPVAVLRVSDSWEVVISRQGHRSRLAAAVATAAAAALAACALAACTGPAPGQAPHGRRPGPAVSPGVWMLTRAALAQMLSYPGVRPRLQRTSIDELLQPGQQPLAGVSATPVVTFSSVSSLRGALAGNALPAGTGAVLYDPEAWPYTPRSEQRDPAAAAAQAARLAHAHGLKLIVSPALNLATVLRPASPAARWQTFLDLGIAGSVARVADEVELQAQSLERDPATYAAFVRAAAAQARSAHPGVTVLAGLSTNPPGAPVDSGQLTEAVRQSRADVQGYWLNIPGNGPRCPACGAAQPSIGAAVLSSVL